MRKNKIGLLTSKILKVLILSAAVYSFSGCSNSVSSSGTLPVRKNKARTEAEFISSASLKANPGAVIFVDLEHLNSPAGSSGNDTGPIGEDVIPYTYTETAIRRIRLGEEVQFKARLESESGEVIYQLNNPDDTARVTIPAGNYKLHLTSLVNYGFDTLGTQAVFIQPDLEAIASHGGLAQVGMDDKDFNTLIRTRKCIGCDFKEIKLFDYNLSYVDISYSDFSESYFGHLNFSHANFNHVNFSPNNSNTVDYSNANFNKADFHKSLFDGVNFFNATFDSTNLSEVETWNEQFIGAKFSNCDFKGGRFTNFRRGIQFVGARFTDCDFQEADFGYANLTNAVLINIDVSSGSMCFQNRTGAVFTNIEYDNRTQCWP